MAYWDWNANSGDTGGIVDDSWVNIVWVKVQWLIDSVQLRPWYLSSSDVSCNAYLALPNLPLLIEDSCNVGARYAGLSGGLVAPKY